MMQEAAMQAAAAANVPTVDDAWVRQYEGDSGLQLANPPNAPDFLRLATQGQPNHCRHAFMRKKKAELDHQLRVAARGLERESNILDIEECVGQGTFGGVTKATCKATNDTWAIKRVVQVSECWCHACSSRRRAGCTPLSMKPS